MHESKCYKITEKKKESHLNCVQEKTGWEETKELIKKCLWNYYIMNR